jgi:diguanylate cyclase (GGDEF)-like protein
MKELLYQVKGELAELESVYSLLLERVEGMAEKAERDELSGLLRRKSFFDRWHALLDRCVALGMESGVLIVDVDHFKKINDTRGHAAGDEVIRRMGSILRRFEDSGAIVGRYGGEEFVVAFSGGLERGLRICREIQSAVPEAGVTVSLGVDAVEVGLKPSLERADAALYEAKRTGRNRACVAGRASGQ